MKLFLSQQAQQRTGDKVQVISKAIHLETCPDMLREGSQVVFEPYSFPLQFPVPLS